MENFKYAIFSIIVLLLLALVGYWAFSSIESGSSHLNSEQIQSLSDKNKELEDEILALKNEITVLKSQLEDNKVAVEEEPVVTPTTSQDTKSDDTTSTTTTLKYQSLINDLQKLVDDKVVMQKGSQGTRVGTVQKFLNIYNGTSNRIDNDYGSSTQTLIKEFQSDFGLKADGEAGPGTFKKMIDWLKKQ